MNLVIIESNDFLRNNISFAPRNRPAVSMTANLVVESSQSISEDLRALMNLLTIPYHIRIGKTTEEKNS